MAFAISKHINVANNFHFHLCPNTQLPLKKKKELLDCLYILDA